MSTTDQRDRDTAGRTPDRGRWAVPGLSLDEAHAGLEPDPALDLDVDAAAGAGPDPDAVLDGAGPRGGGGGAVHWAIAALTTCLEALESVRGVGASGLSPREIRLMLLAVVRVIAAASALKLKLLVAGEAKRVADLTGATSTAAFLAHLTQLKRSEVSAQVRLAHDLEARFPLLADALAAGLLDPDQLRVCVTALRRLPRGLSMEQWQACQRFLIEAAPSLSADKLNTVGRRLWEVIDPDGAGAKEGKALEDEEDLARAKAHLRSWRNGDGTTGFRGKVPDLHADILIKAIQSFIAPRRHPTPDETATPDPSDARTGSDADAETPQERETGRTLPHAVKSGQGLMDLLEHVPARSLPQAGGTATTIVVTPSYDQLVRGLGAATLDTGTTISASQARRLACEAGVIPIVLGGDSQPLDIGRERRFHGRYQRIAMSLRDRGCVAEGCDRPPAWTESHHLIPWSQGGTTSVEDGRLACSYHHHLFHHPDWQTTWQPDGTARLRRRFHRRD
jgi:hypothetical protein